MKKNNLNNVFIFVGIILFTWACSRNADLYIETISGTKIKQFEVDDFIKSQMDSLKITPKTQCVFFTKGVWSQNHVADYH